MNHVRIPNLDAAVPEEALVLAAMWVARRGGLAVPCPRCGDMRVALVVGGYGEYRWACVACLWRSPWFVLAGGELRALGLPGVRLPLQRA